MGSEDELNGLWASVQEYVEIADQACLDMLPRYAVLWADESLTKSEWRTIYELSAACLMSSQSLLHLILQKHLRDAEIIARSILEGTLRFLYILFDKNKIHERLEEFTGPLFLICSGKEPCPCRKILRDIPTMSDDMRAPLKGLLLSDVEIDEARSRYTKQARKSMEERWSATSIVTELIRGKIPGHEFLPLLLHAYARSSHVAHVDYYGIIAMQERYSRSVERLIALEVAHAASLLTQVVMLSSLRLSLGLSFVGVSNDVIIELGQKVLNTLRAADPLSEPWRKLEFGEDSIV